MLMDATGIPKSYSRMSKREKEKGRAVGRGSASYRKKGKPVIQCHFVSSVQVAGLEPVS